MLWDFSRRSGQFFGELAPDTFFRWISAAAQKRTCPAMKPVRIVLSPTRSRHVNLFLGLVLLLVSVLLLMALATWHASDPSLNTATDATPPYPVHNWVGPFGSYLSDLMLQTLGLTAFLLPLWLGGIGWTWMRSRPSGSALLRWIGTLLTLAFLPALFGLMPWHWHWMHLLPVEGVVGRLMAGLLVTYLNIQGAWIVAVVLAAAGLYFASAISLWVVKEAAANYWLHLRSWLDRWNNWREERAEQREDRDARHETNTSDSAVAVCSGLHSSHRGRAAIQPPRFLRAPVLAPQTSRGNRSAR